MTDQELTRTLRRLYWITALFGAIGFVSYFALQGPRSALAFLLGALGSFGNFWLFVWLSQAITPAVNARTVTARPSWKAGAFVLRYAALFTIGYVIVHALGVNALAVVLGLLASTAAVLLSSVIDIFQGFSEHRRAP